MQPFANLRIAGGPPLETMPFPQPKPLADAVGASSVFHEYETEEIVVLTPTDVAEMMRSEMAQLKKGSTEPVVERESLLRMYFKTIPQLDKKGPDEKTPLYSSGVILTEDVLVGYFDEVIDADGSKKDVLHVVLEWSDGKGNDRGWVLPGKRDRAYEHYHPDSPNQYKHEDTCIQDANESLVQKELGVKRSDIAYHFILAYLDDRKREERFKSSGVISFILLDRRPALEPDRAIGVPLNGLKLLAERRIQIAPNPRSQEACGMARGHDSIVRPIFKTAKFCHAMKRVMIAQATWKKSLQENPNAARPAMADVEDSGDCPICFELPVGAHIICTEGHSICGICLPIIQAGKNENECPTCVAATLLKKPIKNLALDALIQSLSPDEYCRRYKKMNQGQAPKSWEEEPAFCGNAIVYRA